MAESGNLCKSEACAGEFEINSPRMSTWPVRKVRDEGKEDKTKHDILILESRRAAQENS
jgi:hypothetical protein